jgi:hypothetical protein
MGPSKLVQGLNAATDVVVRAITLGQEHGSIVDSIPDQTGIPLKKPGISMLAYL